MSRVLVTVNDTHEIGVRTSKLVAKLPCTICGGVINEDDIYTVLVDGLVNYGADALLKVSNAVVHRDDDAYVALIHSFTSVAT